MGCFTKLFRNAMKFYCRFERIKPTVLKFILIIRPRMLVLSIQRIHLLNESIVLVDFLFLTAVEFCLL